MNILILGSGAREHAFAWKISQSKLCSKLFIAPGNAGTMQFGKNLEVKANDFKAIKEVEHYFARKLVVNTIVMFKEKLLVPRERVTSFLHWLDNR